MNGKELINAYGQEIQPPEYVKKEAEKQMISFIVIFTAFVVLMIIAVVHTLFTKPTDGVILLLVCAFPLFFVIRILRICYSGLKKPGHCWKAKIVKCEKYRDGKNTSKYRYHLDLEFPNGYVEKNVVQDISKKYKISTGDYVFVYEKENINKAHFQRYLIPEEAD